MSTSTEATNFWSCYMSSLESDMPSAKCAALAKLCIEALEDFYCSASRDRMTDAELTYCRIYNALGCRSLWTDLMERYESTSTRVG